MAPLFLYWWGHSPLPFIGTAVSISESIFQAYSLVKWKHNSCFLLLIKYTRSFVPWFPRIPEMWNMTLCLREILHLRDSIEPRDNHSGIFPSKKWNMCIIFHTFSHYRRLVPLSYNYGPGLLPFFTHCCYFQCNLINIGSLQNIVQEHGFENIECCTTVRVIVIH